MYHRERRGGLQNDKNQNPDLETLRIHKICNRVGHGVFAGQKIEAGVYLAEYNGERITPSEGQDRIDRGQGRYVYFFTRGGTEHCIDAIRSNTICKFVNDSAKRYANSFMKVVDGDPPKLGLYSKKQISEGEEIRYTYDEDSSNMWWRSVAQYQKPLHMSSNTPQVTIEDANNAIRSFSPPGEEEQPPSPSPPNMSHDAKTELKIHLNIDVMENRSSSPVSSVSDLGTLSIAEATDRYKFNAAEVTIKDTNKVIDSFMSPEEEKEQPLSSSTSSHDAESGLRIEPIEFHPNIDAEVDHVMENRSSPQYLPAIPVSAGSGFGTLIVEGNAVEGYISDAILDSDPDDSGIAVQDISALVQASDISAIFDDIPYNEDNIGDEEYIPLSFSSSEDEITIKDSVEKALTSLDFAINNPTKNEKNGEMDQTEDEVQESDDDSVKDPRQVLSGKLQVMGSASNDGHLKHSCMYCQKLFEKLPRHLETMHGTEDKVKEALSFKSGSKERRLKWAELRREGDFNINIEAYQTNLEPVAVRRCKTGKEKLPCSGCKGFFVARRLSKHRCFMKMSDKETKGKDTVKSSRVFLVTAAVDDDYREVHEKIVVGIKDPTLKVIIRNDPLLLALGAVELDNKDRRRYHDIRYTLRVVARLLIEFRKLTNDDMRVVDLLQPENYDSMLKAVKNIAGYKGRTEIENPHFVLKFGFSLRTLIILGETMYTKSCAWGSVKKMKAMLKLYNSDYCNYSNNAKTLYELRVGNLPEELPQEEDLKILREYCVSRIQELTTLADEEISCSQLSQLNRISFARCLTFNARRGGEPGKLTLNDWAHALTDMWKKGADIKALSDPVEIKLAERLKICYLPGKKKKKGSRSRVLVPMLFTEEVVKGIKKLIRNRSKMGISEENNLVFACGQGFGSLGGWDVLQGITKKLPLQKPKLITPTRTRKMVSTLMQLLDLTDGELTWITNHMGHTKDVQLAWYRKHDSTLELTKVARALMCVDQGNRDDLQNKKIGELDIRGSSRDSEKVSKRDKQKPSKLATASSPTPAKCRIRTPLNCITNTASLTSTRHATREMPSYMEGEASEDVFKNKEKKQRRDSSDYSYNNTSQDESDDDWQGLKMKGIKKATQKRKTWKRWTDAEMDALKRAFILNISRGVYAQKADVLKAQHNFPILNGRPVAQITSQVNNLIRKGKKET